MGIVANQVPLENTITYNDWSTNGGGVLRTETKEWWDQYLLGCDQTTLGSSGPSSTTLYFYQTLALFSQMLEKDEYDFGTSCPSTLSPLPAPTANLLRQTQYTYNPIGSTGIADRPSTVTINGVISPGNIGEAAQTVYSYDPANGNTTGQTQKCLYNCLADRPTSYGYGSDPNPGLVTSMTDPNGHTTSYAYAQSCNSSYLTPYVNQITYPTTTSNGKAHTVGFQYNCASGSVTQSTDENGKITTYDYTDPLARLKKITYPDTGQTTYIYNDAPPTPSIETDKLIDSSHTLQSFQIFDGLGHVTQSKVTAPEGPILVNTAYDGMGHAWTVTNPQYSTSSPSDGTTTYAYDALGRTLSTTNPDTTSATNSYSGNSTTVVDAGGISRTLVDDGLGRLTSVTENGLNYVTTYPNYNAMGDLLTVNQGGQTRSFVYDSFAGLTTATNPENGTITYGYDGNGNMVTKTDSRGTTTYSYDELNRVLYKTYTDASTVRACYAYDGLGWNGFSDPMGSPIGHLTSSWGVQHDGTVVAANEFFNWDTMGRSWGGRQCTPATCGPSSYLLSENYNLMRNETSLVDSTVTRTSSYDTADRLTAFSGTLPGIGTESLLNVTQFGPVGFVTATLGNSGGGQLTETRGYNNRTWLNSLSVSNSVYSLGLGYYGNGDVHTANDSVNGNWTYTYDASNRLHGASVTGQSFTFTPDQYGNMTCTNTGNKPCTPLGLNFNALNNQIATVGYSYDGAGNLLSDNTHGYVYDGENRIRCVWGTDGTCTSSTAMLYFYDAQGQRVGKQQADTLEDYVYDPQGHVISVHDGSANLLRAELNSGGRHVATWNTNGLFLNHTDWLGTERVRTTSTGAMYESCTDTPYGMNLSCVGTSDTSPMHFTGKQRDNETGNDYFGARYNEYTIGRFMTPDPLMASGHVSDPQSWNRYTYALNNPLRFTDPTGMDVAPSCADDNECQITVKVNVVWDKTANNGKGLTDKQKDNFKNNEIDKAIKDYAKSGIKLDVSYSEGSFTMDSNNTAHFTGLQSDAVNIVASNQTADGSNESFMTKSGTAITLLNVNDVHENNAFPLFTNTAEHELAHQFLGDTAKPNSSYAGYVLNEFNVDARVQGQHMGVSQQGVRQGLEPRSYANPTNPEAIKPQTH